MFNTDYQSAESRRMLESLLAEKRDAGDDDEMESGDTTSNDELNAALARSDDELKVFQEMDNSRSAIVSFFDLQ
jgi:hypothetical protein